MMKVDKNFEITCPSCGHNYSKLFLIDGVNGTARMATCKKCGTRTLYESTSKEEYLLEHEIATYDENITCPFCGYGVSSVSVRIDQGVTIREAKCKQCSQVTKLETNLFEAANTPTVTCPFCQSTNCKKISGTSKAASATVFGLFALGKVTKTWHCNNCGSNFG